MTNAKEGDEGGTGSGLPGPGGIAADRIERLRARIAAGQYPLAPKLIADAILACDDEGQCGSTRAIHMTLSTRQTSNA